MKNYLLLKYFGIHVNLKLLAKVLFVIYITTLREECKVKSEKISLN